MICIKCGKNVYDPNAPTDIICDACESSITNCTGLVKSHLQTFEQRSRKSRPGLNIEMIAALFDALDNMGGWEAEKLVSRIIGKADTEESEWE